MTNILITFINFTKNEFYKIVENNANLIKMQLYN